MPQSCIGCWLGPGFGLRLWLGFWVVRRSVVGGLLPQCFALLQVVLRILQMMQQHIRPPWIEQARERCFPVRNVGQRVGCQGSHGRSWFEGQFWRQKPTASVHCSLVQLQNQEPEASPGVGHSTLYEIVEGSACWPCALSCCPIGTDSRTVFQPSPAVQRRLRHVGELCGWSQVFHHQLLDHIADFLRASSLKIFRLDVFCALAYGNASRHWNAET